MKKLKIDSIQLNVFILFSSGISTALRDGLHKASALHRNQWDVNFAKRQTMRLHGTGPMEWMDLPNW